MAIPPSTIPSLGLSTSSSAYAATGTDYNSGGGAQTGNISIGSDAAASGPLGGLINDLIKGVIVALVAKYAWNKLRK